MLLCDIEGTTTSIAFVYETLFPYAAQAAESFLATEGEHAEVVQACAHIRQDATAEESRLGGPATVLAVVRRQMAGDVKATGLKQLQGLIWRHGYETGAIHGHVYADVPEVFRAAQSRGVAIFSSGSVLAQQLLFRHSCAGDLTPLIRAHFDTTSGAKDQAASYHHIAQQLGMSTTAITFATDRPAEAEAALSAGCRAVLILRPGNPPLPALLRCPIYADLRTIVD